MAEPTGFKFIEFHARRAQRGAEAARVEVAYDDGTTDLLWMSKVDIGRNMMTFGRCPELTKAHAAYSGTAGVPEVPATQPHDWREGLGYWQCKRCGIVSHSGQENACTGGVSACPRCQGEGELPNWSTASRMRPCPACKPAAGVSVPDGQGKK